jgi:molybdenum cofactor biosynthesis enzyme MoaA
MEVQSLSIVIPAKCPNRCPFCVSHMNKENRKFREAKDRTRYLMNVKKRMEFARDNGTNTLMITSTGEALENMGAIVDVLSMNRNLESPFKWVELQTSGVGLLDAIEEYGDWFADISTISLSVVDIFSSSNNAAVMEMPAGRWVEVDFVIARLKKLGFNVRLSINLTNLYNDVSVSQIFRRLIELEVDQVTFRKLYKSGEGTKQDKWIDKNTDGFTVDRIALYIKDHGHELERLPFGAMKYSLEGISTVVDDDCMSKEIKNVLKYMIIREDGKLYTKWDDKGSLIF